MRSAAVATAAHAMVVAGHPQATVTARDVMARGGSVADAALAGAAVLAVTLPQACTLGGDAFILVHDAEQEKTVGINASGPSPALATAVAFPGQIEQRGARSCTVPGVAGGWQALHRMQGRLPWPELLAPAIACADDGFATSPGLARATEVFATLLAADPGCSELFLDDGRPLRAGQTLRQPALAETLRALADQGASAIYAGPVAASLASACEQRGGLLRADDFVGYAPQAVEPISTRYHGHEVRVMPPNSYGLFLLLQLMALADAPGKPAGPGSAERLVRLVAAARAAFAVGDRAVADPAFAPEPFPALLGPTGLARLRASAARAAPNQGGTAVISVADARGNAVTIVQSVFLVFGSGVADPDTGILLNNRMLGFTTEPGHPNQVAPRKRPAHTLCPAMVFRDQRLRHVLGTPGGPGQTLTLVQVIDAMLAHGVSLQAAIEAPRWSMDLAAAAVAEDSMPPSTVQAARRLGIELLDAGADSPFFGSAEGIELCLDGSLQGVADHRREAATAGC